MFEVFNCVTGNTVKFRRSEEGARDECEGFREWDYCECPRGKFYVFSMRGECRWRFDTRAEAQAKADFENMANDHDCFSVVEDR